MKNDDISLENLKEKVVCKKCGKIAYRELEQYNIYTDTLNKEQKNLYAIFVKKFKCPKCKSTEYNSYICDMNKEKTEAETDETIIKLDLAKKVSKKKTTAVINNSVNI